MAGLLPDLVGFGPCVVSRMGRAQILGLRKLRGTSQRSLKGFGSTSSVNLKNGNPVDPNSTPSSAEFCDREA